MLPLADVLTPNQFEAEVLTGQWVACRQVIIVFNATSQAPRLLPPYVTSGIKIETESDAQGACLYLHAHGPGTVVVTSAALATDDGEGQKGDCLHVLGSTRTFVNSSCGEPESTWLIDGAD